MRFWSSIIESSRADQPPPPPRCHWHFDKSKIGDGSYNPLFGFHQNVEFWVEWLPWQVTQRVIIFWWAGFVTKTVGVSQCWSPCPIFGVRHRHPSLMAGLQVFQLECHQPGHDDTNQSLDGKELWLIVGQWPSQDNRADWLLLVLWTLNI